MKKIIASLLLVAMVNEIFFPLYAKALTAGPNQPESVGFQQLDQSNLVDLFTGDFKHNIPLMDVDGYPLNLTYNSNVTMEQEASWVGLGWNLQVGSITRSVNGVPDDFNNEILQEVLTRKDRKVVTLRAAPTFELFGKRMKLKKEVVDKFKDKISPDLGIKWSNYDGFGLTMNVGVKPELFKSKVNLNIGFDSQSGLSASVSLPVVHQLTDKENGDLKFAGALSFGMNSQGGIQGLNYSGGVNQFAVQSGNRRSRDSFTKGVDPQFENTHISFQLSPIGKDAVGANKDLTVTGSYTNSSLQSNSNNIFNTPTSGYYYLHNAQSTSIKDFSKDPDPLYNDDLRYLPAASYTFDGYTVSSHGLSGSFRPIRNEVAPIGDPTYSFTSGADNSISVDFGVGTDFKLGANLVNTTSNSLGSTFKDASVFSNYQFRKVTSGKLFEPVVFKFENEATILDRQYYEKINYDNPISLKIFNSSFLKNIRETNQELSKQKNENTRLPRAKVVRVFDASTFAKEYGEFVRRSKDRDSFSITGSTIMSNPNPSVENFYGSKLNDGSLFANNKFVGFEITDETGQNYSFFLPAMNKEKKDVSFSVNKNSPRDLQEGTVTYGDANTSARQNASTTTDGYFSSKNVAPFAHTFYLTHITSPDYVDLTNNGFTDDDLGNFTLFRYSLTSNSYKWRAPYERFKAKIMPGTRLSRDDDKANYSYGSKELWYVNSVVGKHHIAIFKLSPRNDGVGVADENGGLPNSVKTEDRLFKLDEIILYNKHDYLKNQDNATVIKRVKFNYSYNLCQGIPNYSNPENSGERLGKLTLESVQISYGNSNKGKLTPYTFKYKNTAYNPKHVDRWGFFQEYDRNVPFASGDFPYTFQDNRAEADINAANWNLTEFTSPGGSVTKITYEADDYAYVQDKRAMRMYSILGFTDGVGANEPVKVQMGGLGDRDNHYVVVKLSDTPIPGLTTEKLRNEYLKGISNMGFSVMTKIASASNDNMGYDRVQGYCAIDPSDSHVRDATSCFVKIVPRKVSAVVGINGMMYSIISHAQLKLGRYINPGNNPNSNDVVNIIESLIGIVGELIKMVSDPKLVYYNQGVGKYIFPSQSWVRLNVGNGKKIGGGSRVKKIETSDVWSWTTTANAAQSSVYGQVYEYTLPHNPNESSGVATYEPQIGGDENPFKQPDYFLAVSSLSNKVFDYQELPLAESYFPSPSVGYSHVTVKNMHYQTAPSSREFTIHEFHTAKEFPVIVRSTEVEKFIKSPAHASPLYVETQYVASQGYSIVTNSMHGKEKITTSYLGESFSNGKAINSIKYYYDNLPNSHTDGRSGKMKTALGRFNWEIDSLEQWQMEYMNRSVDLIWNSHYFSEMQLNAKIDFDLEVITLGAIPIPIPILFTPQSSSSSLFMTNTLTKHVDYQPILVKTESKSLGKLEEIENLVFDFLHGIPVIKRVYTGGQRTAVVEVPYHLVTDDTRKLNSESYTPYPAPAYKSIDYVTNLTMSNGVYTCNVPIQKDYIVNDLFDVGDVVLLENGNTTLKAWVYSVNRFTGGGTECGISQLHVRFIKENGDFFTASSETYKARIIKKGGKNLSGNKAFSFVGTQEVLIGNGDLLNYDFVTYSSERNLPIEQSSQLYFQTSGNPFLNGRYSGFDFNKSYTPFTSRNYSSVLAKDQGIYTGLGTTGTMPFGYYRCGQDKLIVQLGIDGSIWKNLLAPTLTDVNGNVLETKDNENRHNTAYYSDITDQLKASVNFAYNNQVFVEDFEDYFKATHGPVKRPFDLVNRSNATGYEVPTAKYGYNYPDKAAAHTGRYSMWLSASSNTALFILQGQPWFINNTSTSRALGPSSLDKYVTGFNPWINPGTYRFSVWVRDAGYKNMSADFRPFIRLTINGSQSLHYAKGPVVDGWQKIDFEFAIPNNTTSRQLTILFEGGSAGGWFDDLRIYPKQAIMKSYVYNDRTRELKAILDENNYATFYEYNNALELIRVKKETERGVMTIKEETKSIKSN